MKNQKYREEFRKLLMGISIPSGTDQEELRKKIKPISTFLNDYIPAKLFRYRSCNELNIDAFYKDKIYAITPDKFNDPYDALFKYDLNVFNQGYKEGASVNGLKYLINQITTGGELPLHFEEIFGNENINLIKEKLTNHSSEIVEFLSNNDSKIIKSNVKKQLAEIKDSVKTYTKELQTGSAVACLSENINSVLMWSHYADYHKGFALEYDLRFFQMKCVNCDKYESCEDMIFGNIYPVIYSNERFDATKYAEYRIVDTFARNHLPSPDIATSLKAFLHKSKQWSYENEWRLILNNAKCNYSKPIAIRQAPVAIYYGHNISEINKKILHQIAIEKNIKEYQMYIDDSSSRYKMKYKVEKVQL